MNATLPHLKRAAVLYGGVAMALGIAPGTGISLGQAIMGAGAAAAVYGYFSLMRHLF